MQKLVLWVSRSKRSKIGRFQRHSRVRGQKSVTTDCGNLFFFNDNATEIHSLHCESLCHILLRRSRILVFEDTEPNLCETLINCCTAKGFLIFWQFRFSSWMELAVWILETILKVFRSVTATGFGVSLNSSEGRFGGLNPVCCTDISKKKKFLSGLGRVAPVSKPEICSKHQLSPNTN